MRMSCLVHPVEYRSLRILTTEIPCPPLQVFLWNVILSPLLIAIQSSWLRMTLFSITKFLVDWSRALAMFLLELRAAYAVKPIGVVTRCDSSTRCIWKISES